MVLKKITGTEYNRWFATIKELVGKNTLTPATLRKKHVLPLYWELGKAVSEKIKSSNWGDSLVLQMAEDLRKEFKQNTGFSFTNIKYMQRWYDYYSLLGQQQMPSILNLIPWSHHIQIFTNCNLIEEAFFYIKLSIDHNWKINILKQNLASGLYNRKGKSLNNFKRTLSAVDSEAVERILKNPYNLGPLRIPEEASEKDLENAILTNIKVFLTELGSGFTFYGQQCPLKVGDVDYRIDLLFYHTELHCYFAIDLKVTEFEPGHAGKLGFYISIIDDNIKSPDDNPTIGLLLCKNADQTVADYSLKSITKPLAIAGYTHSNDEQKKIGMEKGKRQLSNRKKITKRPKIPLIKKTKDLHINLTNIIQELPSELKALFQLRYIEGITIREIAKIMRISEPQVEKHKQILLSKITASLQSQLSITLFKKKQII